MNNEAMLNNWVKEMKDYYGLETREVWTVEDLNAALIKINFSEVTTPEWLEPYMEGIADSYSSVYENAALMYEAINEEYRRVFMYEDTVVEMPFKSKSALSLAI